MVIEWTAQFLSRDLFLNLSRSFSFRPARGSIYIINHKLSTTRSTNRCAAVQIRLEQSSTPTIQDYKQRVSTINWDHSIVNEDLILFSYQMHSFSLVTSCPWKESCKIIKATLQTPRTLTLRSPGTSRTPWNSKDFKAFGLTAESCPLPNPGIGRYPEAHRSYDKFIQRFPNGVCVTLSWDGARREDPKSCLDHSPPTAVPSSWACMCRWCPERTSTLYIIW